MQAIRTPTTSQRTILAGTGAAAALPGVATPAATSPGPDDDLLRILAEMEALDRESDAIFAAAEAETDRLRSNELFIRATATGPQWLALRDRVAAMPAHTLAGLQAKARAVLARGIANEDGTPDDDDLLAFSALRDVLALPDIA